MRRTISPGLLLRALDCLEERGVEMHSLLVAKEGELVYEAYWAPWNRDKLHRMYSVTKSFVSLAVGALVQDGLVSLDDRISSYFPEYGDLPPQLSALTIRDMLMMRTCHSVTTYKQGCDPTFIPSWKDDWVGSFFTAVPDHEPGTVFAYDTSSSHVLAALVERLTGDSLLDYLKRRCFPSLHISPDTYIMKDPKGVSIGGSGLMMRPIDLMSVLLLLSRGMDGNVGKDYLDAALSPLSEVPGSLFSGYGYFFWTLPGGVYAMHGMGGQLAYYDPSSDIAVVTTAATQGVNGGDEAILGVIQGIVEGLGDDSAEAQAELDARTEGLHIPYVKGSWKGCKRKRSYSFRGEKGLSRMSFEFGEKDGVVEAEYYGISYRIPFGYGKNVISDFPERRSSPIASSGAFLEDGSFALLVHLMNEEIGTIRMQASFSDDSARISSILCGEFSFRGFEGSASGILEKHGALE